MSEFAATAPFRTRDRRFAPGQPVSAADFEGASLTPERALALGLVAPAEPPAPPAPAQPAPDAED